MRGLNRLGHFLRAHKAELADDVGFAAFGPRGVLADELREAFLHSRDNDAW